MRYIFFDNETDGLIGSTAIRQERWPRIIEFYGALYDEENFVEDLGVLINPGRKISKEITDITGITNEMLVDQPMLPEFAPKIKALFEQANFAVAHNLSFDKTVVDLDFLRMRLDAVQWPALICTVEASEHYKMRRLKLIELHEFLFDKPFDAAHRAKPDVDAMVRCFFEMKRRGDV